MIFRKFPRLLIKRILKFHKNYRFLEKKENQNKILQLEKF